MANNKKHVKYFLPELSEENKGMKPLRVSPAADKFVIRLPEGLRAKIKDLAEASHRSMNAEIIMVLERHVRLQEAAKLKNKGKNKGKSKGKNDKEAKPEPVLDQEVNKRLEELKHALLELMS